MGQAFQSLFDDFSSAVAGLMASQALEFSIFSMQASDPLYQVTSPLQCQCQRKPDFPAAHFQCPSLSLHLFGFTF